MTKRKGLILLAQLVTVAALLGVWQWLGGGDDDAFVSTPYAVFDQLVAWLGTPSIWRQIAVTAQEAGVGFALGVTVAIAFGSWMGLSPTVSRFLDPFIAALNSVPKLALAPLFIMIFGLGFVAKVYFVAIAIFFIPFYNIYGGFRSLERIYLLNAHILGAGFFWRVVDVYGPALIGTLISSLRITISWAFLATVLFESISSSAGIGYLIAEGQARLQNEVVLAGVALVSIIVLTTDRLLIVIERHFAAWKLT